MADIKISKIKVYFQSDIS